MICLDRRHFRHDRGHVLIYVGGKDGLNHENVCVALDGFHHSQIIDVTVTVEVEVAEHIRGVIYQVLELLDSR